ncbi:MAG: S8 family serine peptidase [Planctomycetales bacterium]|nr:S8 family serine peptidase [Planctomycetales bacterium]
MSRKLKRAARCAATRSLRLERLESRRLLHGESVALPELPDTTALAARHEGDVCYAEPAADADEIPPLVLSATSAGTSERVGADSASQTRALDANRDGKIDSGELRSWLTWWRQSRSESGPSAESGVAEPPVSRLADVPDYGTDRDWYLNAIEAPEAWAAGHTGRGVTVAVIDTGADLANSELARRLWRNTGEVPNNGRDDDGNGYVDDVYGWDFVHDDATPQDRNGHGTHVATLLAGNRDGQGVTGVAYGSRVMVLQGLADDGGGNTRDVAEAIHYAVDQGADIINLSLSGGPSSTLQRAIEYAGEHGVLVVAAAGNSSASRAAAPASLSGSLTNVLAVGATDREGDRADFSNLAGGAVQVMAPGVALRAAVPGGYATYSGTSMATPLVSGLAALALSADPSLTAEQLRQRIVDGASHSAAGRFVDAAATIAHLS